VVWETNSQEKKKKIPGRKIIETQNVPFVKLRLKSIWNVWYPAESFDFKNETTVSWKRQRIVPYSGHIDVCQVKELRNMFSPGNLTFFNIFPGALELPAAAAASTKI
jgi:hypothetical protein